MTNFKGIKPEALQLLSENRFRDSKAFYEEHKELLKQEATVPMRQIVLDLSEMMTALDDKMYTDPVYTVSRIRRDTRRSKSKMLYRENLWLMLRRHKKQYPCAPFFWFEFSPECYTYGLGFFVQKPAQFDELRKVILAHPRKWNAAVKQAKAAGLQFGCYSSYKKDRVPDAPEKLKPYLNAKDMSFSYTGWDLESIGTPTLIDTLKNGFAAAFPLYKILIEAYETMLSEGLIDDD